MGCGLLIGFFSEIIPANTPPTRSAYTKKQVYVIIKINLSQ